MINCLSRNEKMHEAIAFKEVERLTELGYKFQKTSMGWIIFPPAEINKVLDQAWKQIEDGEDNE